MTESDSAATTQHVLEQSIRLSESFLWSRQRLFYEGKGVAAWTSATVPNHITTNPLIARAYAKVVAAWLRDLQRSAVPSTATGEAILDPGQPVYIIELGSGPGRFGFYFLRQLAGLLEKVDAPQVHVTYVMTDVVERNLEFLRTHPALQPYVDAGMLDFARFDAENPGELRLMHSDAVLSPATLRNPPICVANYVFDSIHQDLFSVDHGELREKLVTITSPQPRESFDGSSTLEGLTISFEPCPADVEYYDDSEINAVLKSYQAELPNVGFLFPVAALRCIRHLAQLADGRMLLLSADKGFDRVDTLIGQGGPGLALHGGCFSLMVNYDAIGRYVVNRGGQFLRTSYRTTHLDTVGLVLGMSAEDTPRLHEAFDEFIAECGPDHSFAVAVAAGRTVKDLPIDDILSLIRCTGWDPVTLLSATPDLMTRVASATMNQKADLADVIHRVWDEYYHIGEQPDAAALLGVLLRHMQYHRDALTFFQRSLQLTGPQAEIYYEMGVCFYELRDPERTLQCADRALEIDPGCGNARSLRLRIEADRARGLSGPPSHFPAPATEAETVPVKEPVA